jgi:hypothetical protein
MKRFIAAVVVGLSLAFSASAMWVTGGIRTNPTINTVIADTGAISGGSATYTFVCASTVIARFEVAVRNDTNSADVVVQNFFVPANGNVAFTFPVDVPPGGRIVIRMPAAVTGSVQASILKDGPA